MNVTSKHSQEVHKRFHALFAEMETEIAVWDEVRNGYADELSDILEHLESLKSIQKDTALGALSILEDRFKVRQNLKCAVYDLIERSMGRLLSATILLRQVVDKMTKIMESGLTYFRTVKPPASTEGRSVQDSTLIIYQHELGAPSVAEYVENLESITSMFNKEYWVKRKMIDNVQYYRTSKDTQPLDVEDFYKLWLFEPQIDRTRVNQMFKEIEHASQLLPFFRLAI